MNAKSIGDTLLNILTLFGNASPDPTARAVGAIAAIVHSQLTPAQKEAKAPIPFADADGDGIDDAVDTDHGTVAAVTDEMMTAGLAALEETGNKEMVFFGNVSAGHRRALIAFYLAAYNARPKR